MSSVRKPKNFSMRSLEEYICGEETGAVAAKDLFENIVITWYPHSNCVRVPFVMTLENISDKTYEEAKIMIFFRASG